MTVPLKFDHAVHRVDKPEQIPAELAAWGLHAVNGGKHEHLGTYNALTYFGLNYIEWFGISDFDRLPPNRATEPYGLVSTLAEDDYAYGLSRIAASTDRIDELAQQLAASGLEVTGPNDYSRRRPDGRLVEWKLLFAGKPGGGLPLPFFIQWNDADDARRAELTANGTIGAHPAGDVRLEYVAFAVRDLEQSAGNWTDWLGLEAGEPVYNERWRGQSRTLRLGDVSLVFVQPDEEGPAREFLDRRGERPFAIGLDGAAGLGGERFEEFQGARYQLK
ncbi:VOC family protein [Saccharibacillus sp. CPCC 101409]|uniref:VOC family protein n=1 Tax=Saccharibacillus sp. CPCC 101409 TaxID=3058041 RepID=UPI002671DCC2|nr:VOC family protein [Saccharibacillus sp. CPCC 101409]MDO3409276.1 VOC family protein [Saccharibacillus sp. CPCC 101409]